MPISPASILKLRRLNIIDDRGLTGNGESILFSCVEIEETKVITDNVDEDFEEFWKTFPKDDEFRSYSRTRPLRWNKKETKEKYKEARVLHSHETIMRGLRNEIKAHSNSSENGFKYMKSSINWLTKEAFLDYDEIETVTKDEYGKEVI